MNGHTRTLVVTLTLLLIASTARAVGRPEAADEVAKDVLGLVDRG